MLAIRMQRTGRKGHAQFRIIVQDSRRNPKSGKVVALLGNYDPHSKVAAFEKDKAAFYLEHGAQPSDTIARLFKREGVKLPKWVELEVSKARAIRKPEKLRKNRPQEAKAEAADSAPSKDAAKATDSAPAEEVAAATGETSEAEGAGTKESAAETAGETAQTENDSAEEEKPADEPESSEKPSTESEEKPKE